MRILLTNDDGVGAPGLLALEKGAAFFGKTTTLAPIEAHSGCGHKVTTHAPLLLRLSQGDFAHERSFGLNGTPADCVRIALHELGKFDLVLSGINAGGNLGADVYISGTVAAAREAAYHGIPAVAFSHYKRRESDFQWARAAGWVPAILEWIHKQPRVAGTFWNVNFPHLDEGQPDPELVPCPVGKHPLPLDFVKSDAGWMYSGIYHQRLRDDACDIATCFGGKIAISRIEL